MVKVQIQIIPSKIVAIKKHEHALEIDDGQDHTTGPLQLGHRLLGIEVFFI